MATRRKILLVDDAELICGLEKALFRRKTFHLLVARDGRQALELIEQEPPELAFFHLDMPELPGDLCCRRLKSDPRFQAVPVVLLTDDDPVSLARCRDSGCDHVLTRPIHRLRLAAVVQYLLSLHPRRELRREACLRISYGPGGADLHSARTLNLGTGGALIHTPHLLPVATPLLLEIFLPGGWPPIRCQGRVAWLNAPGWPAPEAGEMGVEFIGLSDADKHAIRLYMENEGLQATA